MKKFLLILTGTALVAAGAAHAVDGNPVDDNPHYGPDFWFSAFVVRGYIGTGVSVLSEKYGLAKEQETRFVEQFDRVDADLRRKTDRRMRGMCYFKGSNEQLARYLDDDNDLRIQHQTQAAAELKSAVDAATVLALSAETANIPSRELQAKDERLGDDVRAGTLTLSSLKSMCSDEYKGNSNKGGKE